MKKAIKNLLLKFGWKISRVNDSPSSDFPAENVEIYKKVKPFTMTSIERVSCLCDSINYIVNNRIEGDLVECGVWKGGSIMAMLSMLIQKGETGRKVWLYDTFEGMSEPTQADKDLLNQDAKQLLNTSAKETSAVWAYSTLDEVKANVNSTGYPSAGITYVKGKVEETLLSTVPSRIALLRLDTDWYESTRAEMEILFPRLVSGGVLIIDDYGYWQGARKAIDEYIQEKQVKILLNRIDYTGRVAVKS